MPPWLALSLVVVTRAAPMMAQAVEPATETGEDLDLYAVIDLFKESESIEDFEQALNGESNGVNNLDLDGDDAGGKSACQVGGICRSRRALTSRTSTTRSPWGSWSGNASDRALSGRRARVFDSSSVWTQEHGVSSDLTDSLDIKNSKEASP